MDRDLEEYLKLIDFDSQYKKLIRKFKNKKILLYGGGKLFRLINERYDLSKLNIIGICDKVFNIDEEGGSVGILRLKGFDEAFKQGRIELETRSSNNKFNNPSNITVYALKKGVNSHNQFRAYFYRNGDKCVFVRGHIKKQNKNGTQEYKCIQDTIDHASKN